MSLPRATTYSNGEINKASRILSKESPGKIELAYALNVVDKWRASHAYPMNTFQATLRKKVTQLPGKTIVAQRLKRLPTIIEKLKRHPHMDLSRMQDIGGLRAITESVSNVRRLSEIYQRARFHHELRLPVTDYIDNPKPDGYRGVHLIYKYKNKQTPAYDGLSIELQFRTYLQHNWATAVETMGTFLGKALKSGQGSKEWKNFFALTSSAFAHMENTQLVPGYEKLSKLETYQSVVEAEKKLRVIEKMRVFTVAVNHIITNRVDSGRYFHLLILDSIKKQIQIKSFAKDQLGAATEAYAKAEKKARAGEKTEQVLVSAGPLLSLRSAYPNYFLDARDFITQIERISAVVERSHARDRTG